jgi:drug/metabolite transporter (DMT)-like permease
LFMLAGILSRNAGLMVPGGILSGIGWAAYLVAGPFTWGTETQEGGIFLLTFALGWVSITVVSALFAKKTIWGTLIPAAVLAAVGGALFFGGAFMDVLEVAGRLWPLALIAAGVAVIFKAARRMEVSEKAKA